MTTITILPSGVQVQVAPCVHCRQILPLVSQSRCRGCYTYFYRHGYDRPLPPRQGKSQRRCDCGQRATHELVIQIGNAPRLRTTTLYLCDGCFELE